MSRQQAPTRSIWPFLGIAFDLAIVAYLVVVMDVREPFVAALVGGAACLALLSTLYTFYMRRSPD